MLLFENCSFCYNKDDQSDRPFIIGVKDREHSDDNMERWNLVSDMDIHSSMRQLMTECA